MGTYRRPATLVDALAALAVRADLMPLAGGADYDPARSDRAPDDTTLNERPDPPGPYGAKGAGEPALVATEPAILSAVADAMGVRVTGVPVIPSRMPAALSS